MINTKNLDEGIMQTKTVDELMSIINGWYKSGKTYYTRTKEVNALNDYWEHCVRKNKSRTAFRGKK